jgi:hypothetical protein
MDMEATDDEGTHPPLTTKFSTTPTTTAIATLFSPIEMRHPTCHWEVLYTMSVIPLRSDHFSLPCLIFPFSES